MNTTISKGAEIPTIAKYCTVVMNELVAVRTYDVYTIKV